ncbi:MAG: endo-1,4-beta-xylanase [Flavobacteriaceae bacterium]|nr:endo-1,4-beta-xylanase [Flavobacteriaceae bacterium]
MRKHVCNLISLIWVLSLLSIPAFSQVSEFYKDNWNDSEIQRRIADGIKQNRMGTFTVQLTDSKGNPVNDAEVTVSQVNHDFYFGANGFMVNGFKNPKEDALFEKYFTQLFNFVTIPFYWPELEPQPGNLRFGKDSEYIYRRPAPDVVLDFCTKNNLTPKGHTLVWDNPRWSIPAWLSKDEVIMEKKICKRIAEIAERYGHGIQIWDVVNEVTDRHSNVIMPKDFTFKSFKESERLFPGSNVFTLNFTTGIWHRSDKREYSSDYLLTENLLLRDAKVDAIGMQFHNFNEDEYWRILKGDVFSPASLFKTLDLYSDFNLPIHITEITISALSESGPEYQAVMTENFYKLWFSHSKVEAIIWWNLVDGTAAPGVTRPDGTVVQGEDKWKGGLLNRDFSKKPAFEVLDRLINKEWKTNLTLKSENSSVKYSGFYGTYKLVIRKDGKTYEKELNFPKKGSRNHIVSLD